MKTLEKSQQGWVPFWKDIFVEDYFTVYATSTRGDYFGSIHFSSMFEGAIGNWQSIRIVGSIE